MSIEQEHHHEKEQIQPPFSLPEDNERTYDEITREITIADGKTIVTSRLQRKFLDAIWYSSKAGPIPHFELSEQLKYYPTEIVTDVHKRDRIKHLRKNLNDKFIDGQISLRIDQRPHAFDGKRMISTYYMNRFELDSTQVQSQKPNSTPNPENSKKKRVVRLLYETLPDTANSVRAYLQITEKAKTPPVVLTNEEYTILEMLFDRNGQVPTHTMLLQMESKYDLADYQPVAKAVVTLDEKVRKWMYSVQTENVKSEGIQLIKLIPFKRELYKKPCIALPTPLEDDKKAREQRGPRSRNRNPETPHRIPDENDFRD